VLGDFILLFVMAIFPEPMTLATFAQLGRFADPATVPSLCRVGERVCNDRRLRAVPRD